jgi:hypothetical protein
MVGEVIEGRCHVSEMTSEVSSLQQTVLNTLYEKSRVVSKSRIVIPSTGFPNGLIVVSPFERIRTVEDELSIRRMADALVCGWIQETQTVAKRYDLVSGESVWAELADAKEVPMACFVAWHFRGMSEIIGVTYAACVLGRIEGSKPTIVTCSAEPGLLTPRWDSDRSLIDAMKKCALIVRC